MVSELPVILGHQQIVFGGRQQIKTPVIVAPVRRALETAEKKAVEYLWRIHFIF